MNNKKIAEELLEVLMNSKEHNPAWALKEVLEKLREKLTLPYGVSVWEDEVDGKIVVMKVPTERKEFIILDC
jgi:hypothetical protein